MDALALLCNLYGDGPATLRRLRDAGCNELSDLARFSGEQLARVLDASPTAARRFRHEAELLAARGLDTAEAADAHLAASAVSQPACVGSAAAEEPRSPLERALAAWRAADDAAAAAEAGGGEDVLREDPTADECEDESREHAPTRDAVLRLASDASVPAETPVRAGTPLRPELVEGLDAVVCTRLRQAGIEHAEELLTAELLDLSSACDVALTRLMRIQGHVRRLVAPDSTGLLVPHPRRQERFSPDPLAAELRERSREDADSSSGPFA
ncbi:MAG: hypothetical protein L6Q99_18270 [Planctomycetes bacterium]|nr:hypothetical protein [Planctomycetota bacterium]